MIDFVRMSLGRGISAAALVVGVAAPAAAQPVQDWVRTETRDDCANYNPLRQPLFGDTHVHTTYSADSVLARNRNTPYDAYDFATGGTVGLPPFDSFEVPMRSATIDRPLDFTAVTDHSEGFGEARICLEGDTLGYDGGVGTGYNAPLCVSLRDTLDNDFQPTNALPQAFVDFFFALVDTTPERFTSICGPGNADCATEASVVWQDVQDAADAYYDRTSACTFTTFKAYEWSGQPAGNNLHRNIIFRNDDVPALPISYYEKPRHEDMRAELKTTCLDSATNCDVLAIPHNSNMAIDQMFHNRTSDNGQITAEHAQLRSSLERIMELSQVKGESECRDGVIGTTDELCNFENNTTANILSGKLPNDSDFSQYAYARGGLKRGLQIERTAGVNPFALGFIGSTDTHNGVPGAVNEVTYGHLGQTGIADSTPAWILADATQPSKVEMNPGGLAVVWAEENSRDAIFAAMRRRETYSTSGTRPIVRVFGGRPPLDLCTNPALDFVEDGYATGVPMGGDIGPELGKSSPRFAIMAQKDPGGLSTPLQRAQIIKGWTDADGAVHELVYDVAGTPDSDASVDIDTCTPTGHAGHDTLCTVWEDPEFDPTENAFYYVRIVENPVCRWHQYLCNDLKTCSVHLNACSLDKTRTCTTDGDCSAHSAGTCTEDYPVVCVTNADCDMMGGAGTCGATPAVDCSNPSSVPAAAAECCDSANPPTIQERAVASPIYYHPGYAGLSKGKIGFKDEPSSDRLQLGVIIYDSPSQLDPATKDLVLTLRDSDSTVWTATIPANTMTTKKAGASYSYKDKTGAISGITGLSVKISSKGVAKIKVKTGDIDLSGIARENQKLALDFVSGTYSSTAEREWVLKGTSLGLGN